MAHNLLQAITALRESGTLTDCQVVIGKPYKTHRLGSSIEHLSEGLHNCKWRVHRLVLAAHSKALLDACMKSEEAEQQSAIDHLIDFLYTLDYSEQCDPADNVMLFVLAREFKIPGLAEKATAKFPLSLSRWDMNFMESNFEAVEELIVKMWSDKVGETALGDTFVRFVVDVGAFAEDSPIRERMEELCELSGCSWLREGVARELAKRKSEHKAAAGELSG